ncbi:penicillin-binding protein 2 [Candidatus Peregrinibacteria bacterium]|nr:penicillin-binding protein 2 [Candidatus Peregrinibacteria bacterium]
MTKKASKLFYKSIASSIKVKIQVMVRHPRSQKSNFTINKITLFIVSSGFVTAIIIFRLFQLQILSHAYYQQVANISQHGYTEIPAQRGEILMKDYHSGEEFPIATNTTLNLLYADPALIKDPQYAANAIAPIIFDIEDERAKDEERRQELAKTLAAELNEEEIAELLKPLSDSELETNFKKELLETINAKKRAQVLLGTGYEAGIISEINKLGLAGIEAAEDYVYAYPPQISQLSYTAEQLAPLVQIPAKKLETVLKGENRYTIIKRKLDPDIANELKKMLKTDDLLHGLAMKEEYFRYYPEGSVGANIVGYVNHANIGQYGIESAFNTQLQGKAGKLQTKKDSIGRQITVGESQLEQAVDGDDILLTIDRSVQLETEKILEAAVKEYRADSGQVVIMDPQTGGIIAMAHYPSFDPNHYGDVFEKEEIFLTTEEVKNLFPTKDEGIYYFYKNPITLDRYLVFEEKDESGITRYYRYKNIYGPEVYHNKIVSWPYEPGSVFKTIVMAAAIDDGDVTPNTTYVDSGPVDVDYNVYSGEYDFQIKNSEGKYYGLVNMEFVIAKSLNTGMTFVAKKMGPALLYSYLKKFGFLDRTDIEFEGEALGQIEYFEGWTESELATHAFGQGITVSMLQVVNGYAAIANGGILMQPYIIDEIHHDDGTVSKTEPMEIRRVISEDAAAKMTAILVNSTENGVANKAQVEGHFIAGKTGTSQTYKHGQAMSGNGTTIGTFAGYAPIEDPRFVILVKFDRAQSSEWGSNTAAPTFNKIADYLFEYYNIPPDK